jgi:hypothetical protein
VFKKFLCGCVIGLEILLGIALFILGIYLVGRAANGDWQGILGIAIYFVLICGALGALD